MVYGDIQWNAETGEVLSKYSVQSEIGGKPSKYITLKWIYK